MEIAVLGLARRVPSTSIDELISAAHAGVQVSFSVRFVEMQRRNELLPEDNSPVAGVDCYIAVVKVPHWRDVMEVMNMSA